MRLQFLQGIAYIPASGGGVLRVGLFTRSLIVVVVLVVTCKFNFLRLLLMVFVDWLLGSMIRLLSVWFSLFFCVGLDLCIFSAFFLALRMKKRG